MICPQQRALKSKFAEISHRAKAIPHLTFIERVEFADSGAFFRRSKIFVGTSEAEGFANTYIQACIAGVPIVSYEVDPGGFLERTGAGLVAGGNFNQFLKDISRLLEDEAEWRLRSDKARQYALASHDIDVEGRKWSTLFSSFAEPGGRTPPADSGTGAS
jgi:glycosyltransferase involved in cell wall biosynthesis